jgi:diguanylate cyclase (GGDEF)-like protein
VNENGEKSTIFFQVFDMVDIGLVILDKDLHVRQWNRWMQLHSGIDQERIVGSVIFDVFPNLKRPRFLTSCKTVFTFGNFNFFSQKLHHYLFPFKPISSFDSDFKFMQQSCTMGPVRNEKGEIDYIFISVHDVTEAVNFEQKLLEMNMKDALTGINNRRCLEVHLQDEIERHNRYNRPLSLIMFDIDFFKKINDTYGHQCGDYILKSITSVVEKTIRKEDLLARYGGEEFCCLLPETSINAATILAERFRKNVAQKAYRYQGNKINVTISLGVSALTTDVINEDMLLKKADEGLYKAKNTGRNRVVTME